MAGLKSKIPQAQFCKPLLFPVTEDSVAQEAGPQNFVANRVQPVTGAFKPLDNMPRDSGPPCQDLQDGNERGPRLFMPPSERVGQSLPPASLEHRRGSVLIY